MMSVVAGLIVLGSRLGTSQGLAGSKATWLLRLAAAGEVHHDGPVGAEGDEAAGAWKSGAG